MSDTDNLMRSIATNPEFNANTRAYAANIAFENGEDCLKRWQRDFTNQGAALRYVDMFRDVVAFCPQFGWVCWDGKRWKTGGKHGDKATAVRNYMMLADIIKQEAISELSNAIDLPKSSDERKAADEHIKFASSMRRSRVCDDVLEIVSALLIKPVEMFDADPYILNTPSGIIDLHTGEIYAHDPKKYCTKITNAGISKEKGAPGEWAEFVEWITGGDQDLARYLQDIAGMAAIGRVTYEGVVIAYGAGGNGKSTFFNAQQDVLGDYSTSVAPEALMVSGTNKSEALFSEIHNARLVIAAESEEGKRLSVSTIKQLASTDMIRARRLYHDAFNFKPTHTLVLFTNHLPKIGSNDTGTWRRIIAIPFTQSRIAGNSIKNYGEVLAKQHGPEILQWIVDGAVRFIRNGSDLIDVPKVVQEATAAYRASEDWVSNFVAECCTKNPAAEVKSSLLYSTYRNWAERNGEYARRVQDFTKCIEQAGYVKVSRKNAIYWRGLRLQDWCIRENWGYNNE